jgi:cell division septation protein DedD
MRFITIPVFLATLAWTAVFVLAYNDWTLILRGSLPAWVVCSALWALTELIRLVASPLKSAPGKAIGGTAARAAVALAVSLGISIFAVSSPEWLQTMNEPLSETIAVDVTTMHRVVAADETHSVLLKEAPAVSRAEAVLEEIAELWSVQVGSFRREQDAAELATVLRKKGYEAYVMQAEVGSVSLYRAKVGRFKTRIEAERLLKVLKDKEAYTAAFVSRM